jgi:hypothetical protein
VHRRRSAAKREVWGDDAVRAEFHVEKVRRDLAGILEQVAASKRPGRLSVLRTGEA